MYYEDKANMSDIKSICFFAPNLAGGGAERVISILATYFGEEGYKVDLILADAMGPYLSNLPKSVNIIDLKCKKVIFTLPKLIDYLKKSQPNILFTSQMHVSTIAIWANKIAGVRTKVIIRQPTMLAPQHEKKSWSAKLKQKIFLSTSRFAHKIIVTSKNMAYEFHMLSGISNDKIKIVYNPVPIESIQMKMGKYSNSFLIDSNLPIILGVGRLVEVKGFETLIKSFNIVQKSIPSQLIILGEGPLRPKLESLIEELELNKDIHLIGFVENPYEYMRLAKVFVLSSLWEGFPNGMVEAMTCGAAIVSTNCQGGASEILEEGKWGHLVPVTDEVAMANAIVKVLIDKDLPDVCKRANDFSINSICKEYMNVFGA